MSGIERCSLGEGSEKCTLHVNEFQVEFCDNYADLNIVLDGLPKTVCGCFLYVNEAPRSKLRGIIELNFEDSSEAGRNQRRTP
jgi:hypothetical protein